MHTMLSVLATPDVANIRTAEFRGQDHTVIPVVALVEGVLWAANAPRPELALAEEFGRFPGGWDGRPVVYDHPKDADGVPIAANDPAVLEDNAFGQMFNTTLDGKKLKSEIWINEELVKNLSDAGQATVAKLMAGDSMVEVSTGLFLMSESSTGDFEGKHFEAIWRNIVPDHLAILPEGVPGACSVADGCGAPRDHNGKTEMTPVMYAAQMNDNCQCDAPNVTTVASTPEEEESLVRRLLGKIGNYIFIRGNSEGINDSDLRTALDIALTGNEQDFIWIAAVFQGDGDAGTVVYQKGFESSFLERDFSMNADGGISLGDDKTSVRPETQFVPIELQGAESDSSIQENAMHTKEELVNGLIANTASQFAEEDRDWLETLEVAQLTKLAPVANADSDASSEDDSAANNDANDASDDADADADADDTNVIELRPVSTDEYIAAAPDEVQQVLMSGLSMHRARKTALVTALVANSRCKFTKEQLDSKDIPELENLAALAVDISYELGGANLSVNAADDQNVAPEPLKLFDLQARTQS